MGGKDRGEQRRHHDEQHNRQTKDAFWTSQQQTEPAEFAAETVMAGPFVDVVGVFHGIERRNGTVPLLVVLNAGIDHRDDKIRQ